MDKKEKFKQLGVDLQPVIELAQEVLENHEVDCPAYLTVGADGYISFTHHTTECSMVRICTGESFYIMDRNSMEEM